MELNFGITKCLLKENLKPPERKDLPIFTFEEVKQHGKDANRIWVTYKQGVYDITDFIQSHPGGDKILLAAGNSIEPYWLIYAQHKTDEVLELLEELRIGSLSKDELKDSELGK
uniref:Cytochrome b5 heme-binding domain-containing protein n=1 Tax=Meloidogyne javanica TaxID=6303 RepID=A0A915MIX5_MELJA